MMRLLSIEVILCFEGVGVCVRIDGIECIDSWTTSCYRENMLNVE